jgi:hypothetical protein
MKIKLDENEPSVSIPLSKLAEDVYSYSAYLRDNFKESELIEKGCDTAGGDMRLQVNDGWWTTHHGDSQYDQDHRGFWGCGFVPYRCTRKEAREIARDLISDLS